jgi:hypothetical protein
MKSKAICVTIEGVLYEKIKDMNNKSQFINSLLEKFFYEEEQYKKIYQSAVNGGLIGDSI